MIYLSASSIKDFITVCNKTYYWRTRQPAEIESTPDTLAGNIVHKVIENHWNASEPELQKEALFSMDKEGLPLSYRKKVEICVANYYSTFSHLLTSEDMVEFNFKLKLDEDVYLVGRIDRIVLPSGLVIDWKTSASAVNNIDKDIQFLIYYYAFSKTFNRPPSLVTYASLYFNKFINLNINKEYYKYLFDEIVPEMIVQIRNNNFYRQGLYTGKCGRCLFNRVCLGETVS